MAELPVDLRALAQSYAPVALRALAEIAANRSAPYQARVDAATQILNRGLGCLVDPTRYAPIQKAFYVYSIHDEVGRLIYIGKGSGGRHLDSAKRLNGKSRVRAEFDLEKEAFAFERRLIKKFMPKCNIALLPRRGEIYGARRV